jgi:hypothetical protein
MKVIIEIPDDTQFVDIICKKVVFDMLNEEPSITMNTDYQMVNINQLEIVHESCKGCKWIGNSDEDAKCDECKLFQYWEEEDETNT